MSMQCELPVPQMGRADVTVPLGASPGAPAPAQGGGCCAQDTPPWKAGSNLDTSSADTTPYPEGSLGQARPQPEPGPRWPPASAGRPSPRDSALLLGRGLGSAACGGPGQQALGWASLASGPVHVPGLSAGPPTTPGIPWGKGRGGELPGTCRAPATKLQGTRSALSPPTSPRPGRGALGSEASLCSWWAGQHECT